MEILDISQRTHNHELTQTQHKYNNSLDSSGSATQVREKFSSLLPHSPGLWASAFLKGRENDAVGTQQRWGSLGGGGGEKFKKNE